MRLRSLELSDFRKFDRPVRLAGLADGMNVLSAPNEFGKSTLLDAIRGVLFERHSSHAQAVRRMQHWRDRTSPVVALGFELAGGLHRIEKRFLHREPYARLTLPDGTRHEGDAAEEALQALLGFRPPGKQGARAEDAGMWGALWVAQRASVEQPVLHELARTTIHACLESELGALTGGARGQALLSDVRAELGRLLDGNDRPRLRYKEVAGLLTEAEDNHRALGERRRRLDEDLEALQQHLRDLAAASNADEAARLEADLAQARLRRDEVLRHDDLLRQAAAGLQLAEGRHEAARAEAGRRQDRARQQALAVAVAAGSEAEAAEAQERLAEADAGLAAAAGLLDLAARNEAEAAGRLRVARAVAELAQRASAMTVLEERLRLAERAQATVNALVGEAAAMRVDAASVQAVHAAVREEQRARAVLDAQATLVELDLEAGAPAVLIDGTPPPPGSSSRRLTEPTEIVVPGIGRLRITPAIRDRHSLQSGISHALEALRQALAAIGASDPEDAERRLQRRQACEQRLAQARAELSLHTPADRTHGLPAGIEALRNHLQASRSRFAAELDDLALPAVPSASEAEARLRDAIAAEAQAASATLGARAAFVAPQALRTQCFEAAAGLGAALATARGDVARLQRETGEAAAQETDAALELRLGAALQSLQAQRDDAARAGRERPADTLDGVDARIRRYEEAIVQQRDRVRRLQQDIAVVQSRIQQQEGAGIDEQIAAAATRCDDLRREYEALRSEAEMLTLLRDTLLASEREAKERYMAPVAARITPYLRGLFPGVSLTCDENFRVTGLHRGGSAADEFDRLSDGTQEQIAVLSRLAFADMLLDRGRPAMVILDDALAYSDRDRMERMFDLLTQAASRMQILVLTCRGELFTRLGGHRVELVASELAPSHP
ncbi:AAA family ATPase [Lichenicoccus sp.]|uniref:AAA family ATPase n=1 Tax=Lichenicoccus sp. TaxID=2781899 RepID=UPI003D108896